MCRASLCLTVLACCGVANGQNLLVNPSFQDPAFARIQLSVAVVEGDTVEVDTGGAHRIYEFDTDTSVTGSNIPVDVSGGLDRYNAANQLAAAIEADALSPADAKPVDADAQAQMNNETPEIHLFWKTFGGGGATNTSSQDFGGGALEIDDFNELCRQNFVEGGQLTFNTGIPGWSGDNKRRNGDVFIPESCLDGEHASLQGSGGQLRMYQTVSGLDNTKSYLLSGLWTLGDFTPSCTFTAELHDGDMESSPLLAQAVVTLPSGGKFNWLPFSVAASPTGTDLTVVLRANDSGGNNYAMHVDDLSLVETTCTPPTVTSFSPNILFRGTTYDDAITVMGTGFVPGSTTVRLEGDDVPDIVATDVQVAGGGTSLVCDLDIPAAAPIKARTVVVEVSGCGGNALPNVTFVLNSGPFRNGSFEQPTIAGGCPAAPQGPPTFWDAIEINGFGGATKLFRNDLPMPPGPLPFLPTCPPPDGVHDAAAFSEADGGGNPTDYVFQTFQVTPAQEYSFSGFFAGSGANSVTMEMRDGLTSDAELGSTLVRAGSGSFDWTFSAVSGTPNGTLMTVGWRVIVDGDGPHTSFADDLAVLPCNNPITVTGVTPTSGVNSGVAAITHLAGTGFSDAAGAPMVILSKAGNVANATNVQVVSATQITCDIDLTGLPSGKYDLIVVQDGCVAKLSDVPASFQIIATDFVNGSFENPSAPENCGGDTQGTPTGWNFLDELLRDASVHVPTCPGVPDGIHHGSMTTGLGELEQAWQTVAVNPGSVYRWSGQFAGGGTNDVRIKLLNGDESGTLISETLVHTGAVPYDWTPAQVEGAAPSTVMTLMWEMDGAVDASATHADALVFEVTIGCHDPFADADGDGDVDQDDYGVLQQCITGAAPGNPPIPGDPAYCVCFNRNPGVDAAIDQIDVNAFENCASGPTEPANAACDD